MKRDFSRVIENALFAMVDLFLDFASEEYVDSQKANIEEFLIDCLELEHNSKEFKLIQAKFEEEFENHNYFVDLEKKEVVEIMEKSTKKLVRNLEVPPLLVAAINNSYEGEPYLTQSQKDGAKSVLKAVQTLEEKYNSEVRRELKDIEACYTDNYILAIWDSEGKYVEETGEGWMTFENFLIDFIHQNLQLSN